MSRPRIPNILFQTRILPQARERVATRTRRSKWLGASTSTQPHLTPVPHRIENTVKPAGSTCYRSFLIQSGASFPSGNDNYAAQRKIILRRIPEAMSGSLIVSPVGLRGFIGVVQAIGAVQAVEVARNSHCLVQCGNADSGDRLRASPPSIGQDPIHGARLVEPGDSSGDNYRGSLGSRAIVSRPLAPTKMCVRDSKEALYVWNVTTASTGYATGPP